MNSVNLVGRMVADPILSKVQGFNGETTVAKFRIAVDRVRQNPQAEQKQTDFLDIICWGGLAENIGKFMTKGRLVSVSGSIHVRSYDDSSTPPVRRKAWEIRANQVRFLDRAPQEATTIDDMEDMSFTS